MLMLNKNDLRNAIASKNRGISASSTDRQAIASIVARIEDRNPTAAPLAAPELLAGDWRLLYTTSQELLGIDKVPFASLGNIYQCVRPEQGRIYNIAEIKTLPYCDALVSVVADFTPAPVSTELQSDQTVAQTVSQTATQTMSQTMSQTAALSDGEAFQGNRRVNVKFSRGVVGLQGLLGYQSPAQYVAKLEATEKMTLLQGVDFSINSDRQQGWLEITYLDEDLRIGRGNQGSLFVLTK
jgi:hypothetical protein